MSSIWQKYGAMIMQEMHGWVLLSPTRVHRDQKPMAYTGIYAIEYEGTLQEFVEHLGISLSQAHALIKPPPKFARPVRSF